MSCVYKVTCEDCGKDLDFSVELDNSDDLVVEVTACEACLRNSYFDGHEYGKELGIEEGRLEEAILHES